ICAPDASSPLSHGDPAMFAGELTGELAGLRVAWCPDVGGLPIAPEVLAVLDEARDRVEAQGCHVGAVELDRSRADEAFETLRGLAFARGFGPGLEALRSTAKDTLVWNVEQGLALDARAIASATVAKSQVFTTVADLMQRFDVLVAPAAQVAP